MKKQPALVAILILGTLCGIFWIGHTGWRGFSIDHTLNPVQLATLAVSVFIAYFLQFYFASRTAIERAEKEILLDDVRDVLSILRELRDLLMACYDNGGKIGTTNAKSIKRLLRQTANGLETLETAIGMSHCSKLEHECRTTQDALFSYKSASTGGNFPTNAYDAAAFNDQERTYRALNRALHDLVFKITRLR